MSWGFKFGQPPANIKFDVSYFTNPWREKSIRYLELGGREKILEFMLKQEGVHDFCTKIKDLLIQYDKLFPNENIVVAICCSAGEYRSPAIVELVAKMMPDTNIIINHSGNSKI